MSKKRNNIRQLDGNQRAALGKFQKDINKAMPHMVAMAENAKTLRQAMVDAPFWRIIETPKPDEVEPPEPWTVGHAQVNYVKHIKHEGAQQQ